MGTRLRIGVLVLAYTAAPAFAWVYPEHRDITVLAVESLDPDRRQIFDGLWAEARAGNETRLCEQIADSAQGVAPECIDWAAMPAIAGDHSCSAKQMLDTATDSTWILQVADVAAQLKVDLARVAANPPTPSDSAAPRSIGELQAQLVSEAARAKIVNALRVADIRLQRADPEYATRAGSSNAHFLLPRPRPDFTAPEYWQATLRGDESEINALGVYGWYHLSAGQKASRIANEQLTDEERRSLARSMLADEAFALHFLEDMFAAGHVAGTWGDVSQRKGTHDYYNEHGLEVMTWAGGANTVVLMGDAHMRPEDAQRAAATVRQSLEQILDVASGRSSGIEFPYTPQAASAPAEFDVCTNQKIELRPEALRTNPVAMQYGLDVGTQVPVPSLESGLGAMPRFRAEIGAFVGVAGLLDARYMDSGYSDLDTGSGYILGAELSLRAGYGLDGVLDEAGDGLVYFGVGYRGDSASSNEFNDSPFARQGGSLTAAIPGRNAFSARLRMPFYLIPGDLLLLSPMYLFSPDTYQQMAVTAANGGLIPWQVGLATRFGRFQFVLGRELGVTFYGVTSDDTLLTPGPVPGQPRLVQFRSTYFDLPIFEYRPYRAFDMTQTSNLVFQVFAGVDIPDSQGVIYPVGAPDIDLDRVYTIGVRMIFDWRRYF